MPPTEPTFTIRPPPLPDQRQERLHHGDGAEQVDLELLPEVGERLELDRRRLGDARVVDQAGEAVIPHGLGDGRCRRRDCRFVRHVEDQRRHRIRGLRPHGLAVLRIPHPCENVEPIFGEVERRGSADARGGAGHDDEATAAGVAGHSVGLLGSNIDEDSSPALELLARNRAESWSRTKDQPLKPEEACSSPALSSLACLPSICATELLIEFGIACFT